MYLTTQFPAFGFDQFWVSPPEYSDCREINHSFSAVGAFTTGEVNLTAGDRPLRVRFASVNDDPLTALGVPAPADCLARERPTSPTRLGLRASPPAPARAQAFQRLLERLRALPGVPAATAMSGLPPNRPLNANDTDIDNYTAPPEGPYESVDYYQNVMTDYFETKGIPSHDVSAGDATITVVASIACWLPLLLVLSVR